MWPFDSPDWTLLSFTYFNPWPLCPNTQAASLHDVNFPVQQVKSVCVRGVGKWQSQLVEVK